MSWPQLPLLALTIHQSSLLGIMGIVTASRGNCGQDIWIFHAYNYMDVLPQLPSHTGDSHALNVVRCISSKWTKCCWWSSNAMCNLSLSSYCKLLILFIAFVRSLIEWDAKIYPNHICFFCFKNMWFRSISRIQNFGMDINSISACTLYWRDVWVRTSTRKHLSSQLEWNMIAIMMMCTSI